MHQSQGITDFDIMSKAYSHLFPLPRAEVSSLIDVTSVYHIESKQMLSPRLIKLFLSHLESTQGFGPDYPTITRELYDYND